MSTSSTEPNKPPVTLLSVLQRFNEHDTLKHIEHHNFHRLAPKDGAPSMETLHAIVQTTQRLTTTLDSINTSAPDSSIVPDAKTIALLKQHLGEAENLFIAQQNDKQYIKALRERNADAYGEYVPLVKVLVPSWCIEQIESWAKAAGLECFKDPHPSGEYDLISIMVGGQVLVMDIELHLYSGKENPRVELASLKTTNATADPSAPAKTRTSIHHTPDILLFGALKQYLDECQKPPAQQDCVLARKLGFNFREHLQYLAQLDKLVASLPDGDPLKADGSSWFDQIGLMAAKCEALALQETTAMASANPTELIPFDTFVMRAHSIPLPYLTSPSLSFLTYVSPIAYLSLQKALAVPAPQDATPPDPLRLEAPVSRLREWLRTTPEVPGAIVARLSLEERTALLTCPRAVETTVPLARPRYLQGFNITPVVMSLPKPAGDPPDLIWVLNFGKGVVMSQSRMKEIETVVGLMPSISGPRALAYGQKSSWIELLVGNVLTTGAQRYTTIVVSPSSRFPPLHVTLQLASEPGYLLGRVPVRSLQETLAVLEIVKEQCWLNENIKMFGWTPDQKIWHDSAFGVADPQLQPEDLLAEIAALLDTTRRPERLLISASIQHSLFEGNLVPSVKLTVPTKSFGTTTVEVAFRSTSLRPLSVTVDGIQSPEYEEIARRAGPFALGGYVWEESR